LKSSYAWRSYALDKTMTSKCDPNLWPRDLVYAHDIASLSVEHFYEVLLKSLHDCRRYALDRIWTFHHLQWLWTCNYWPKLKVSQTWSWLCPLVLESLNKWWLNGPYTHFYFYLNFDPVCPWLLPQGPEFCAQHYASQWWTFMSS
jgi:hypothetical protein